VLPRVGCIFLYYIFVIKARTRDLPQSFKNRNDFLKNGNREIVPRYRSSCDFATLQRDGRSTTVSPCGRSARDVEPFPSGGSGPDRCRGIFGVDELMDMGRTCVNLIGNCLATIVVARWEGEFDDKRARVWHVDGSRDGSEIWRCCLR